MKVTLQTRFNRPASIYDTDAPAESSKSGAGKLVMSIVKPYLKVQEGSYTLYEMNKPYPDNSAAWQVGIGLAVATALIGTSALIFGLGRASK